LTHRADKHDLASCPPGKLNAGLRCAGNQHNLLIVDEPTAGLDPKERIRFGNLLVRLATERTVILSTHIVEDIGQTCRDMAVLAQGQVAFRGSPAELTQSAAGHVWMFTRDGAEKPAHNLTVVSMLHLADGIQYRLVGQDANGYPLAKETQSGLKDGYDCVCSYNTTSWGHIQ
jgi:ABC-type multidrug transport system ATPase subunit